MVRWFSSLSAAAHRADFWSRLCFIGLSGIVAACSAYGFFTAYDVWDGVTVASAGGVALAALCAIAQFCSLNLSHQARRREGRDRALCLVLMVVCGGWSAYGLHHFWDVTQAAAALAEGRVYVPIRSLEDIDGSSALMMAICVAIAFVEPLTFWVLGGSTPRGTVPARREGASNVTSISTSRKSAGRRVAAALAVSALAAGAMPGTVSDASAGAVKHDLQSIARSSRDIGFADVQRVADRLHREGERVSFRRIAAELETSKSRVERIMKGAGVQIGGRWPPLKPLMG